MALSLVKCYFAHLLMDVTNKIVGDLYTEPFSRKTGAGGE
jgi:hypothetical protein